MNQWQKILEDEKNTLLTELKTIAVENSESGDWVAKPDNLVGEADPNVTADNTEEWNERRALVAQLETRYHNVKLALHKIENNTYGICEVCGEHIENDRLKANPAARTCKIHLEHERELPF